MNRLITSTAIPARAVKIEALATMTASFESFCLASGIEALAEMMENDARTACGPRHARGNKAHIAYLREPNILTREAFEAAKRAEAVALELRDTEVRWLARIRATTVIGLKLKASYASTEGKLADSIIEDILQL